MLVCLVAQPLRLEVATLGNLVAWSDEGQLAWEYALESASFRLIFLCRGVPTNRAVQMVVPATSVGHKRRLDILSIIVLVDFHYPIGNVASTSSFSSFSFLLY